MLKVQVVEVRKSIFTLEMNTNLTWTRFFIICKLWKVSHYSCQIPATCKPAPSSSPSLPPLLPLQDSVVFVSVPLWFNSLQREFGTMELSHSHQINTYNIWQATPPLTHLFEYSFQNEVSSLVLCSNFIFFLYRVLIWCV